MSARTIDTNGWIEIKGNPISKAGVFEYQGSQLPRNLGLSPNKTYNVYRPQKELAKQEAIESFKLLPWTDDHPERLLGSSQDGLVPAESKGVHGVTGEDIYMDGEYLLSNLKVFSQDLADQINSGKKDLSIGYKADYILQNGVYNGDTYEVVQTNLKGNHISLVDEGRSGREVSVLDNKDKEVCDMNEEKKDATCDESPEEAMITLPMLASQFKELKDYLTESLGKLMKMESAESSDEDKDGYDSDENEKEYIKSEIKEDEDEDAMDADKEKKEDRKEAVKELDKEYAGDEKEDEDKKDKMGAMDAAAIKKSVLVEMSRRDQLASKLSNHIGVFDSASMTLSEVSRYGIRKLGLSCKRGSERSMLEGYLAGKRVSVPAKQATMDASVTSSAIDSYLAGE